MERFEILYGLPKCNTERRNEQMLLEKWHSTQHCHALPICNHILSVKPSKVKSVKQDVCLNTVNFLYLGLWFSLIFSHLRWVWNADSNFPLWVLVCSWAQNSPLPDSGWSDGGASDRGAGAPARQPPQPLSEHQCLGGPGGWLSMLAAFRTVSCLSTHFIVTNYQCSQKNGPFGSSGLSLPLVKRGSGELTRHTYRGHSVGLRPPGMML